MTRGLLLTFAAAVAAYPAASELLGDRNLIPNPAFTQTVSGIPDGWTVWSPRPALAADASVVPVPDGRALQLRARDFATYGKWIAEVPGIVAGKHYRFEVRYRAQGVQDETVSTAAILSWCAGERQVQRDYADRVETAGDWRVVTRTLAAPEGVTSLKVELALRWTERGTVLWTAPALYEVPKPGSRPVRLVTTRIAGKYPSTVEENLRRMSEVLDRAAAHRPDLVLLSETYADRGVNQTTAETAQTIPGPATRLLAAQAKRYRTYVAASINEREGDRIYNTAVLLDREGRLVGKYRKSHLPMEEGERGVTPGSAYPVFETDFGRVGMMVCWDNWFPEVARALRLAGAEIVLLPIAGDEAEHWDVISRARAIDNGLYLIASGTVGKSSSRIIDPSGAVLAETMDGVAAAEIDLAREWRTRWLSVGPGYGEAKSLYLKERRPDTYGQLSR
jgi:predicted amidohydrolase